MAEATLVTVLRHGEVAGRSHVFRGASDEPLSDRGFRQMRAVLASVARPDRVACSPMRRCQAFAAAVADELDIPLAGLPGFAEMRFGAWEGLTREEAAAAHPGAYSAFLARADTASAPGGESLADFRRRVLAAWQDWATTLDGHGLLVTHAGVMRVLLGHLLDLPGDVGYRVALPEAGYFQVSLLSGHPPVLLRLNACADSGWPSAS